MAKPIQVALAGISGYGQSYVDALSANKAGADFELVAVVDPFPQRSRSIEALRGKGVGVYPTMLGMFGVHSDLDLVILSTPIHLHATQIADSIRAGANVLCEKPLAGSVRDAQRVIRTEATAEQRGKFVAIGYQWSFSRAVLSLKSDILEGKLGRCLRMRTRVDFPREQAYFRRNSWAGRMHTPSGEDVFDSPVNNATAHYLHNMLFLLGDRVNTSAVPVTLRAELYRANDIENFDTAAMRCEMRCGAELLFYTTHTVATRCGPMFSFEFEHATVTYDHREGEIKALFRNGETHNYGSPERDRDRKIWMAMDAVRSRSPLPCTPRTSYAHTLCAAAALESCPSIIQVPGSALRTTPGETTPMIVVDGLSETLNECYEMGTLPSESGRLLWSQPGNVVSVEKGAIKADDVAMIA